MRTPKEKIDCGCGPVPRTDETRAAAVCPEKAEAEWRELSSSMGMRAARTAVAYLVQMHNQATSKLRLIDFDVNTPPFQTTGGITDVVVSEAYKLNRWATPVAKVLWFKWKKTAAPAIIRLNWNIQILPLNFKLLAFRMCQVYDEDKGNSLGSARDVVVSLITSLQTVEVGKVSVPFPFTSNLPSLRKKTVLSSFVLSLAGVIAKLSPNEKLKGIQFSLTLNAAGASSIFMLGEVELWA